MHHFANVAKELGHEVVSVDIVLDFKPTIVTVVLTWDYEQFENGVFDCLWLSPRPRSGPRVV